MTSLFLAEMDSKTTMHMGHHYSLIRKLILTKGLMGWMLMVYICNPSYLGS
jgi:hypothetical protein